MFIHPNQRGVSLIELIMFIVIVSIGMIGIMQMTSITAQHGADTILRKQALSVADGILEDWESITFSTSSAVTGQTVTNLTGYAYSASAVLTTATVLTNIPAASAVLITVAVSAPNEQVTTLTGYQINY